MAEFQSKFTGQEVENAIDKLRNWITVDGTYPTVTISGVTYAVIWKIIPTHGTPCYGIGLHPTTGRIYEIYYNGSSYTATALDADTKNTAGATNSTEKLYLVGAKNQSESAQTYSNSKVYTQNGKLYSNNTEVSVVGHAHSNYATPEDIQIAIDNIPLAGFEDILKGIKGRTQVEWNALNAGEYGSNSTYNGATLPPVILENNSGFWNSASGRPLDISFHFAKKEKITTLQVKCPPYSGVNPTMTVYYAQSGDHELTLYKEIATISTADRKTYEFNEEGISADYWVVRFTSSGWIELRLCSPGGLFTTGLYTEECHQQIMDRFNGYQPVGNYALKSEIIAKSLTSAKGDMIYASDANTPARLGIGSNGQFLSVANGVPTWVSSTDETITLATNLYAYTNIGKITGASNTSPKLVANKGDTLKTVFNKVFGTQQDEQPSINTNGVNISKSQGTTSFGGGEYGESISDTTDTITFTLNNSATAQYGYRCGNTKTTTSNATFKYAIKKQNNADIVITLPANKTATVVSNYGALVSSSKGTDSSTNNILYCNFNNDKKVKIQISLAAGNTTTNNQTRYGVITGSVTLGDAQTSNGTKIDKFLTYLENDATTTDYYSGGTKSATTTSYTIRAGYVPYCYALASSVPNSLPTSGRSKNKPTSITVSGGNSSTYLYIFVPSDKSDITSLSASGFDVPFSKVESNKSLVVNNNKSANYKVFKTDGSVKADTFKIA